MSQLGVTDLPARKKKKHKRKNIPNESEPNTTVNTDQIFKTANDFMIYSLKKKGIDLNFPQSEINQDHTSSTTNQNTQSDIKEDTKHNETNNINNTPSNTSLIQKIHEYNTNPQDNNPNTLKTSQYLKQLRKQHQNDSNSSTDQSSDDINNPTQSSDPLLTLLNIKPKEKDKPITIEYDDRVYDKVIFQDEEFKEYRKNNIAVNDKKLFQNTDTDKIIHQKTNVSVTQTVPNNEQQYYNEDIYYENEQYKFQQKVIPKGKLRPNYFIALKITDMRLKRKLQTAQSILMKELGDEIFERALIDENVFHITLNAIYCDSDDEVFYLMNKFEEFGKDMFQKLIPTKLSVRLHVNGIDHFRQNVIYGCIDDDINKSKLENVFHALRTCFKNGGIVNQQHRFDPHLTIMKLSKIRNNKGLVVPMDVIDKMNSEYNKSLDFGYQYVNGLELLSMIDERNNDDVDDYYQCISTIAPMKLR